MLSNRGWGRGLAAAVVAVAVAEALTACSSGGDNDEPEASLPAAATLLKDSAAAMRQVHSSRFELHGKGSIAGVEVDSATGVVTSDGDASGSVQILQNGQNVHLDLIVHAGDIYIKGPTGDFAKLPPGAAGSVFDPSQILNPDRGLASLMEFAKNGKTVGEEDVEGVDTYKVTADLDGSLVSHLMPLPAVNTVPGTLWIGKDSPELHQIMVTVPKAGNAPETQLTLRLFDFGVDVDITPPS